MKDLKLLIANMVLTCFALFPVASLADDDLDVTMEVLDNLAQIEGVVLELRGPEGDDEGDDDSESGEGEDDFGDGSDDGEEDGFEHDGSTNVENDLEGEDEFDEGDHVDTDEFDDGVTMSVMPTAKPPV